ARAARTTAIATLALFTTLLRSTLRSAKERRRALCGPARQAGDGRAGGGAGALGPPAAGGRRAVGLWREPVLEPRPRTSGAASRGAPLRRRGPRSRAATGRRARHEHTGG